VLCLSLRSTSEGMAKEILATWFGTPLGTDPVDMECVRTVRDIEAKWSKDG
jgi:hypothetical protein